MFVIPPSASQEEYFNEVAENAWNISNKDDSNLCESLKLGDKTMVVNCKINIDDGSQVIVYLNYRYFKSILYCFVQETDPSQTTSD